MNKMKNSIESSVKLLLVLLLSMVSIGDSAAQCSPDATPPVIVDNSFTAYLSANGDVIVTYSQMATVTDACDPSPKVTINKSLFKCADIGAQTVTVYAEDVTGNATSATVTVTIADNSAPKIVSGQQINQDQFTSTSGCTYSLGNFTTGLTVTDNCSSSTNIAITQSPTAGTALALGANTITITATDQKSNATSYTFVITVKDNTKPVISAYANQTPAVDASCNAGTLGDYVSKMTVSDNCTVKSVTQSPASSTSLTKGTPTTVTITAEDLSGNTSTITFTVTATDQTNPVAKAKAKTLVLDATSGTATLLTSDVDNASTDNCGIKTYALSKTAFDCSDVSLTPQTVTLTVTDDAGRTSTATASVTIQDNTAPSFSGITNKNVAVDASCNATLGDWTTSPLKYYTVADNCLSSVTISQSLASTTALTKGTPTTVTLTATDASGNVETCALYFRIVRMLKNLLRLSF